MLLQTNSYIVPRDKRMEHARLLRRFRQTLMRLGCDHFEVYEQVGANWNTGETTGRFVQIMRFRDRKHQLAVQGAERTDPVGAGAGAGILRVDQFPLPAAAGIVRGRILYRVPAMPPQRTTTATEVEQSPQALPEVDQFVGESQGGEAHAEQAAAETSGGELAADGGEEYAGEGADINSEDTAAARNMSTPAFALRSRPKKNPHTKARRSFDPGGFIRSDFR